MVEVTVNNTIRLVLVITAILLSDSLIAAKDIPNMKQLTPEERPDVAEKALWNIPKVPKDLKEDGYRLVSSTSDRVKKISNHPDDFEIKEKVCEHVLTVLKQQKIELLDPLGDVLFDDECIYYSGEVSGRFKPLDRTLEIGLSNPKLFSSKTIQSMQAYLEQHAELWRIGICGTYYRNEPNITIYADAIRIGNTLVSDEKLENEISKWQAKIKELRDDYDGCRYRQFAFVRTKLLKEIATLSENEIRVIALFDRYDGEDESLCAWTLSNYYIPFDYSDPTILSVTSATKVNESLEVVSKRPYPRPTFQLKRITLAEGAKIIKIKNEKTLKVFELKIDSEKPISDKSIETDW